MDHDQIDALAHKAGCLPEAVTDVRSRVLARFAGEAPEPATVERWLTETLKHAAAHLFPEAQTVWAKLGMDKATFDTMPPTWRKAQADQLQPPVTRAHPRRPVYRNLTTAELKALDETGLVGAARTELARQWQQTPAPQG